MKIDDFLVDYWKQETKVTVYAKELQQLVIAKRNTEALVGSMRLEIDRLRTKLSIIEIYEHIDLKG